MKFLLFPLHILIACYRYGISPFLPVACRFEPSCSVYAKDALHTHGLRGLWFTLRRVMRCHPWGGEGYDPVPASKSHSHCSHTPTSSS